MDSMWKGRVVLVFLLIVWKASRENGVTSFSAPAGHQRLPFKNRPLLLPATTPSSGRPLSMSSPHKYDTPLQNEGSINVRAFKLPSRRQQQERYERDELGLLAEVEERSQHLLRALDDNSNSSSSDTKIDEEACVEVMMQWARRGKADAAELFYQKLMGSSSTSNNQAATIVVSQETHMTMLRSLLHAWSNRLRLVPRASSLATEAAKEAGNVLDRMMELELQQQQQQLDASDFATVLQNHLFLKPANVDAVYQVWKQWQERALAPNKQVDPPSLWLSARIIRDIANLEEDDDKDWATTLEYAAMATAVGDAALSQYSGSKKHRKHNHPQDDDEDAILKVYNALLEVWSKALPPPSKQRNYRPFSVGVEERQIVGQRTKDILEELANSGITPNFQTYATVLYAYGKAGWLEEAWDYWKLWKQDMLSLSVDQAQVTTVDIRCLPMLIQSTVQYVQAHLEEEAKPGLSSMQYCKLGTEALYDMWALYDHGYPLDLEPDVDLYRSLLCCWANPRLKSHSMNYASLLVQSLNERHRMLTWSSLQPSMAFYNAWISVVRSQFGNATIPVFEQAGLVVKQMEQQSMDDPSVAPDTSIYNFLIDACLSDGSAVGVERGEQTLVRMMDMSAAVNNSRRLSPNGRSFASIIRAWDKFDTSKAEYWLDRMEERFIPSSALFEEVILRCCEEAKTPTEDSAGRRQSERARRLLYRMIELSKVTENPNLRPSRSLFSSVVEACEKSGGDGSESEIEKLRETMNSLYLTSAEKASEIDQISSDEDVFRVFKKAGGSFPGDVYPEANTFSFNIIIRQLANTRDARAGQVAEEIFVYMLDQYVNNADVRLRPDLITFNSVILAWSKSPHPEAAHQGFNFLKNLNALHDGGILLEVDADLISYNTAIAGYQRSKSRGAAEEAERVYNSLRSLYESTKDRKYRPDTVTFCSLLGAYANKGNAHRAEELLLRFYKEYKSDRSRTCPDASCFDQVLLAWAKTGGVQGTKRAEMLLKLMEDMSMSPSAAALSPATSTYNIVLHALSNSGDLSAPFRAQMLLERMKSGYLGNRNTVRLDTVTYTTAIGVMCRLGGRGVIPIKTLLDQAIDSPDVQVSSAFFANVLSSLACCFQEGIVPFAEELIEKRMPELGIEPEILVWNGLLTCFARRGMGEEAQAVLDRLESGPLEPNLQTYTVVLDAYAKSQSTNSITRAEDIIQRMQSSTSCKPDVKAYTALIQKYARSNLPLKAKRAQAVLQRMKEGAKEGTRGVRPTVVTYNALLNACEYTNSTDLKEKEEAFTVACLTFDEVRKVPGITPSHVTYGSFLGSVTTLMPKSSARSEIADLVFKRCCKDGQVSQYVLRKMKAAVSLSRYRQMLGGRREDNLPRTWTSNVRERRSERSAVQRKQSTPRSKDRAASVVRRFS